MFFFFSSRRRHTRWTGDWSSDVCSSDLDPARRTDGETRLGAGGDLARGLVVAADEGGLGGGEVGLREVTLSAIRHRKIIIAIGNIRVARHCGAQTVDRLVGE